MAGTNLTFSKVVATPTQTAWSQAYSAGSLFGAFSLQTDPSLQSNIENLSTVGKDLISTLESEFFPLENKNLESIKQAITTTVSKIGVGIVPSFVICYLNENVLYLYASGGGKAVLKRGEKIGTVVEGIDQEIIKSTSGYVQSGDIIVLQTKQFQRIIASAMLASALEKITPDQISEEIAPHVHDKSEGGASAVILSYKEGVIDESISGIATGAVAASAVNNNNETISEERIKTPSQTDSASEDMDNEIESAYTNDVETMNKNEEPIQNPTPTERVATELPKTEESLESPFLTEPKSRKKLSIGVSQANFKKLPKSRRLILIIGIILIVLIIIISILALVNMRGSSNQEQFQEIYSSAREKIDEAESLKELNASLSQESYKKAQSILEQNKDTFPQGSTEDQKIEELLVQVNTQLQSNGGSSESSEATEVDRSESELLSAQIDNPEPDYFTQNKNFIYFLDDKGVNSQDKGNDSEKIIIKKSWTTPSGIGTFGSNIYVLDSSDTLLKFVPSGDEYTKNDYFSENAPDLSNSTAMAIDGSIFVLNSDGTIQKFTKGVKDDFNITGLEKPMSNPTRIFTNEDLDNIYILDNKNGRVVVLDKSGQFIKAYSASIMKNARDIDVSEVDKKILILSDGKIYKIDLK